MLSSVVITEDMGDQFKVVDLSSRTEMIVSREKGLAMLYGHDLKIDSSLPKRSIVEQLVSLNGPCYLDGKFINLTAKGHPAPFLSNWVEAGLQTDHVQLHLPAADEPSLNKPAFSQHNPPATSSPP